MTVIFVEPQLWVSAYGSVMPGMVLPIMEAAAADAWKVCVTFSDEGVEFCLGLFCEVTEGFYCELSNLEASSLLLCCFLSLSFLLLYALLSGFGC